MDWKILSDRVPLTAKAIAAGRWQRTAILRRAATVKKFRKRQDSARMPEGYWVVLEACLAQLEGRILTQKDLVALASGTASAATISRSLKTFEESGFIIIRVSETDARVRIIKPSAESMDIYMSLAEAAWQAFWSVAETALNATEEAAVTGRL